MKRVLIFTLVIGLFAVQADAAMWELDRTTALDLTNELVITGSQTNTLSVYDGPTTKVYGPGPAQYGSMSGMVGYFGGLTSDVGSPTFGGDAILEIYYDDGLSGTDPGLSGAGYDGIGSYFENDNQSKWSVQLFYVDPTDGGERTSAWAELAGFTHTYLTADASGTGVLDLSDITNIGFRIQGNHMGAEYLDYPSYSDDFHISAVPVPGAVLLGILGLGVVGIKLRKYA